MHVHICRNGKNEGKERGKKNPFKPFLKQVMACTEISHDLFVIWVFEL